MKLIRNLYIFIPLVLIVALSGCLGDAFDQNVSIKTSDSELALAPDFTLPEMGGGQVTLSEFRGQKPVLLVFWASWCGYCRQEVPRTNALRRLHSTDDLEILGVNLQESEQRASAFAAKLNFGYRVVLDSYGDVANLYHVQGLPTMILIDAQGQAIAKGHTLGPELNEIIRRKVNEAKNQ